MTQRDASLEDAKTRIEDKLLFNLLFDRCAIFAEEEGFDFSSAYCSNSGVLRLSSPSLEMAFPVVANGKSAWHNNHSAFYEMARTGEGSWSSRLAVDIANLNEPTRRRLADIEKAIIDDDVEVEADETGLRIVKRWMIGSADGANETASMLDQFARTELLFFDRELMGFLIGTRSTIRGLPRDEKSVVDTAELPDEIFVEGAQVTILSDKFERDRSARARCIAEYGAQCAICGFDFGKVYGDDFSGKIEVHHIVPLNEIRENHVVDPVRDLIPVCPNCHLILHSKDGERVFMPDEVREMIMDDDR